MFKPFEMISKRDIQEYYHLRNRAKHYGSVDNVFINISNSPRTVLSFSNSSKQNIQIILLYMIETYHKFEIYVQNIKHYLFILDLFMIYTYRYM